jgi:transcriptional regulator with XRE-family HTH domain
MFGDKLKALRISKNLKQKELASQLGISTSYMTMIENGQRDITLTLLKSISRVLKIDITVLVLMSIEEDEIQIEERKKLFQILKPGIDNIQHLK